MLEKLFPTLVAGYFVYYLWKQLSITRRRKHFAKAHGCQSPYTSPDSCFGLHSFISSYLAIKQKRFLALCTKRFEIHGSTYEMSFLGTKTIATIDPLNLEAVQSRNFKSWCLGPHRSGYLNYLLGPGIFSVDGRDWARSRRLLRPFFAMDQISNFQNLESHVTNLINAIPSDEIVDLKVLFYHLFMDNVTLRLFGKSTRCLTSQAAHDFASAFDACQQGFVLRAGRGLLNLFSRFEQYESSRQHIHAFVQALVDDALEGKKGNIEHTILGAFQTSFDNKHRTCSELLHILFASRDSTASLLSNFWWILSRRPDIWAKLRYEVANINDEKPTYSQIKEMRFLRAVFQECLRLYPVIPLDYREALVDTMIPSGGGKEGCHPIFTPKGTILTWNTYAMHRRKDIFGQDAEEFRPERWLEDGFNPVWAYLPFSGGPRTCLGRDLALAEASYVSIRLLQTYSRIRPADDSPWIEQFGLATSIQACPVLLTQKLDGSNNDA